jgi:hypothetical protein
VKWRKLTSRTMVILYFGCFALLWVGLVATAITAGDGNAGMVDSARDGKAGLGYRVGVAALAFHAAVVVLLAWKAHGWLFSHGPVAVVFCGAPLVPLVANLWLVPALLYLIAVLHVWLASRRVSPGRLQSDRRRAAERGPG